MADVTKLQQKQEIEKKFNQIKSNSSFAGQQTIDILFLVFCLFGKLMKWEFNVKNIESIRSNFYFQLYYLWFFPPVISLFSLCRTAFFFSSLSFHCLLIINSLHLRRSVIHFYLSHCGRLRGKERENENS